MLLAFVVIVFWFIPKSLQNIDDSFEYIIFGWYRYLYHLNISRQYSVRGHIFLYINIAMSCSLRFRSDGSSARTWTFSYDSEWELSARSWILSIFLLSEDLQLCYTRWQYVKWGRMDDLYIISFNLHGIKFRNLNKTPNFWLAFMQMLLIWLVKLSLSSISDPKTDPKAISVRHLQTYSVGRFSYLVYPKYCNSCISSELESPVLHKIQVENSSFHCIFHCSTTALVTKRKKIKRYLRKLKPAARQKNFF